MRNLKNNILLLLTLCFFCLEANAQCFDESNYWMESWTSCNVSASPNTLRGNTIWLLYEFTEPQAIAATHMWNANRLGESSKGAKTVFVDVSADGTAWTQVGADQFTWPKATELDNYEGFVGPDLSSFGFIKKILFSFVDNHEGTNCISIGELRFEIDKNACYGKFDACGICNGSGYQTFYEDADSDGLGNPNSVVEACDLPLGYVDNDTDNCDNGLIGWDNVATIFSDNGCNGCHNGPTGAGNLDLTSYAGISAGGSLCGTNILTGTVLADIILISEYDGCSSPISFPSMNERVGRAMDATEIQLIQTWINDGALLDCNCPNGSPDSDGDGTCDYADICNGFNDALIGTACDDGDAYTIQDIITTNCECVGLPGFDTDFDGVSDGLDLAPNNPCTADGILGMPEPSNWVANETNDCDLDGILLSAGDLNDFDKCIDDEGSSLDPACICIENFEVGGGQLIASNGIGTSYKAAGVPDGDFTGNINANDYMVMSFPHMENEAEICFTVGFNSADGAQFEVNDRGIYKFENPDLTLTSLEPQVICFPTFMAGPQKVKISRYPSGTFRIDGATYNYCPCTESDPNKDFISCACPNDFTEEVGTYSGAFGIANPELSDGAPDGKFTAAIAGSDSLILTYPSLPQNYQICLDVLFSSIEGLISLNINGESLNIVNPAGIGEDGQVQNICFFTNSNDSHTVVIKDAGTGTLQIDGSTCGYCNPCSADVDLDGICDDVDICLFGDDLLDQDADGIPDACDECNGNLIGFNCDDGNNCTFNDIYDSNCDCVGSPLSYQFVNGLQGNKEIYAVDSITLMGNFDILSDGYFQAGESISILSGFETSKFMSLELQIENCSQSIVTLHTNCDYAGSRITLNVGEYPNVVLKGFADDALSAIKIPTGYQVVLYESYNFEGASITLTADDECLNNNGFDNDASSIRILDCNNTQNIAIGKTAIQSSTYANNNQYSAANAIDGNKNGVHTSGSLSHTINEKNAWWEIDLGAIYDLSAVKIWNRTNCCADRLTDFHVLVSDKPFSTQTLSTTISQSNVGDFHFPETAGRETDINLNRTGRYLRIQLSGKNALQLAEVEIMACAIQ